jgi:hypothetical protein
MAIISTRDFINTVFIKEVGILSQNQPYIAFMVMGIGIEFLGKCIAASTKWHEEGVSRQRFEEAISKVNAFAGYRHLIGKKNPFDLYTCLRCGMAHAAVPKYSITLSSKNEMANLAVHKEGKRINLKCEDFYTDFKTACEEVIKMPGAIEVKMNKPFLEVPDHSTDIEKLQGAITHSIA